ncbi:NACHT domain-containing protein [Paludisphaera rhizosphaerae]|uniref:NACHT domain-containing protein n=1 Tax=Paludisphaera rhizosphaerae TaxID=2711216 RepID=UPI0013EC5BBF|nr:hypothetical protein [Paludisphaera rhizosphaerae]
MNEWPIQRSWSIRSTEPHPEVLRTYQLVDERVCCLLGAAGMGKTFEMQRLKIREEKVRPISFERLAAMGATADRLESELKNLSRNLDDDAVLYLDALDEALVRGRSIARVLAGWIRDDLSVKQPWLRISCRSAEWPESIKEALAAAYPDGCVKVASLQPLDPTEIGLIASAEGFEGDSFLEEIRRSNTSFLAQQPLTLRMLFKIYRRGNRLPSSRWDLFDEAVNLLAGERAERHDEGTAGPWNESQLIEAAERLACFVILSGCEAIDLSDDPLEGSLGSMELGRLPSADRPLDREILKAIGRSGLCEGDEPRRFRFVHRQIAEYLAGRRIGSLPLHQSRPLLASGQGWQSGVAKPLLETAAFAAIRNPDLALARWVAENDPEIIGRSDVADDTLRRRATLRLIELFRSHELTDAQMYRDQLPTDGLKYTGIEEDLRPVLSERVPLCEDVLEFTIKLIENCGITSLHQHLADLTLDPSAPIGSRVTAGGVLQRRGTPEVRARLRPLITGSPEDEHEDLKGIALRCCWPDRLSSSELFSALSPWSKTMRLGDYGSFLYQLGTEGFDAAGCRLAGLKWAKSVLNPNNATAPTNLIVQRIARGALAEIGDVEIGDALAELLLEAARIHSDSPFDPIQSYRNRQVPEVAPLQAANSETRHLLIQHLAARADGDDVIKTVTVTTPGLVQAEDFCWLLENAVDSTRGQNERENLATIASLNFRYDFDSVEAWLRFREMEPVRSILKYHLCVKLESDLADTLRHYHSLEKHRSLVQRRIEAESSGDTNPAEQVLQTLELAEAQHPNFFFKLCNDLKQTTGADRNEFERFPTRMPGWIAASLEVRSRIVEAGRRILTEPTDAPKAIRSLPFDQTLHGHMCAVWLLLKVDPVWLDKQPSEWWEFWSWYLLRGINLHLVGEPKEPKHLLFKKIHERTGGSIKGAVTALLKSDVPRSGDHFLEILELYEGIPDPDLDALLLNALADASIRQDSLRNVVRFLLGRMYAETLACCASILHRASQFPPNVVATIASVLLNETTSTAWDVVLVFFREYPDLVKSPLGYYASLWWGGSRPGRATPEFDAVTDEQTGELIARLIDHFPPESDPVHDGAYFLTEVDSAVRLREALISSLGARNTASAVTAIRKLESRFGSRYPWLRRPRSTAERAYRRSDWKPIRPQAVAQILLDSDKRLIQSKSDAIDGIIAAVERFETSLRHESPSSLEDLWNTATGQAPTPKPEEQASDKLCVAIRRYFKDYAVAADREIQISRRLVPTSSDGEPGSRGDIIVRVPDQDIVIPIEVKRSDNREAKTTGLTDQLHGRYMSKLGTDAGVFVVVWFDAPDLPASHKPVWASIEKAREHLREQVTKVTQEFPGTRIEAIVIDASLR